MLYYLQMNFVSNTHINKKTTTTPHSQGGDFWLKTI